MELASLEKQLIERVREEQRRWQDIASLLMRVKREGLWQEHASSFTAWVDGLARRADLQSSVFWRCLNAGRIYLELTGRDELDDEAKVSAEALELTDKIRRHAPESMTRQVVSRTLDGEISRAELRRVWDTVRTSAGGATARGRLPDDPAAREEARKQRETAWEVQRQQPQTRAELRRGELVAAFREASWLEGIDQAHTETKLSNLTGRLAGILVARKHARETLRLELHGLWTAVAAPELVDYEYKPPSGLDFVWLAVPSDLVKRAKEGAPHAVGILELRSEGALRVARPAHKRPLQAEGRLALYEALMQTAYLWPAS